MISRYERDEMVPLIDAAKKVAGLLDTTVGYLLGETDDYDLFKDPEMLKRFWLSVVRVHARKTGISQVMVGKYERGDASPSIEVAKKIADALEVR